MQEIKAALVDEEQNIQLIQESKDDVDPAITSPDDPPGCDSVVDPALKTDVIETESRDTGGSGTGSPVSEPSIKGQDTETRPVNGSDHKHDISQVTASQESERGFSGFDLNEEFSSEEKPECSLSGTGTHSNSKQRSGCLDIDLNVPSGEESSVDAGPSKIMRVHLDLNMCQSMSRSSSSSSSSSSSMKNIDLNNLDNVASLDHQKPVFSLFGAQVEMNMNHTDVGPRVLGPGPSMYYYSSPYTVDPRAVPIGPQFAPPFVMNMAGGSHHGSYLGPTGAGALQQNMGLNLGLMVNGGNSGGSSGSVVGGKRLEPDGGWEGFPVSYKHQQPPWK